LGRVGARALRKQQRFRFVQGVVRRGLSGAGRRHKQTDQQQESAHLRFPLACPMLDHAGLALSRKIRDVAVRVGTTGH
jgi:hypothetical protein